MDEKEMMEFSWTALFFVTGVSSFIFNAILKILDGSHSHLLLMTGYITLFLGVANWGVKKLIQHYNRKKIKAP